MMIELNKKVGETLTWEKDEWNRSSARLEYSAALDSDDLDLIVLCDEWYYRLAETPDTIVFRESGLGGRRLIVEKRRPREK